MKVMISERSSSCTLIFHYQGQEMVRIDAPNRKTAIAQAILWACQSESHAEAIARMSCPVS